MEEKSASDQIDDIIQQSGGWKGELLSQIRSAVMQSEPDIVEEIKWKMATRPEGLPVWSCGGIICFAETWKDNIKLLFPKGAQLKDPNRLFNSRLQSKTIRAIEYREGDQVKKGDLLALVRQAIKLNSTRTD